jgi:5,6-dimethylbenzimidazole synthase
MSDVNARTSADNASPQFDDAFRTRLHELFVWRRDVRRFRSDPLPDGLVERLIGEACLAPSVGLCQPWRFVVVDDRARRDAIIANFRDSNRDALDSYDGERRTLYARLKLAGLHEAPCHLAVFADEGTPDGHGLGRHTMPEMLRYSAVTAVCLLWLAARAEGIGMGWVSILDPDLAKRSLDVPEHWALIGYFCLGYPEQTSDQPELEHEGWQDRRAVATMVVRR